MSRLLLCLTLLFTTPVWAQNPEPPEPPLSPPSQPTPPPVVPSNTAAPLQIKKAPTAPAQAAPPQAQPTATPPAVPNSEVSEATTAGAPAAPKTAKKELRRLKRVLAVFEIEIDGEPTGTIKAQLFPDKAPETVENFVGLVEGTKQFKEYDEKKGKIGALTLRPFYDGLIFHRIVGDYVIQGGCPLGTGRGNSGSFVKDEINKELKHNAPGILAMSGQNKPNSNSSQFYITLKELKHLDGKYTVFGKVIDGMDVVNKIGKVKSDRMTQVPQQTVTMKSVKIVREYFN